MSNKDHQKIKHTACVRMKNCPPSPKTRLDSPIRKLIVRFSPLQNLKLVIHVVPPLPYHTHPVEL